MGVVARRYVDFLIILLIPTPLVLSSFLQQKESCATGSFQQFTSRRLLSEAAAKQGFG